MDFDPVARKEDFKNLTDPEFFKYAVEQKNAYDNDELTSVIKEEFEKLLWADLVIFQFPLWWFSVRPYLKVGLIKSLCLVAFMAENTTVMTKPD